MKNKTQKNFTMISNSVLRDKDLSMKDRGVLCTICSLPDGWEFSIAGLSSIVPDGVDAIRKSIFNLEELEDERKKRTRRLIEFGGIIESVLGRATTDEDKVRFLNFLKKQETNGKFFSKAMNGITASDEKS